MKKFFPFLLVCFLLAACAPQQAAITPVVPAAQPEAVSTAAPSLAQQNTPATANKRIGLVAHDSCKPELLAWVASNASLLAKQEIFCTGTTGRLVAETLQKALPGESFKLTRFHSGPLGGDQQMGALISENGLDILVFFIDPMSAHPHATDIQALMRLSQVYNIVVATTPATADYVISSPLFIKDYAPAKPEYSSYVNRKTP